MKTRKELGITRDFESHLGKEGSAHSIPILVFLWTHYSSHSLLGVAVSTSFYSESQPCFPFRNQFSIAEWIIVSNDRPKASNSLCWTHRPFPDLGNSVVRDRVTRQYSGKGETTVWGRVTRRLLKSHSLLETTWQISFNVFLPFEHYVLGPQRWLIQKGVFREHDYNSKVFSK